MTNKGRLRIATTQSISGEFAQTGIGVLDFKAEGDGSGLYGSLMVSGEATLAGRLGLELTHHFTPAVGDSFNLLDYDARSGDFSGFSVDGVACEFDLLGRLVPPQPAGLSLPRSLRPPRLRP